MQEFQNPFRPGAGQLPPYFAGREKERNDFKSLLLQSPVLKNLVLIGLKGVGKTVLLDRFKTMAVEQGWIWAGNKISDAVSRKEQSLPMAIIADLAPLISSFTLKPTERKIGGNLTDGKKINLSFPVLSAMYQETPGLDSDKLKYVLEVIWNTVKSRVKGIVLAYDEAQILKDQATEKQYPLSFLLEVIQYLQSKKIPYLLVLSGLPTLFQNLTEARTYSEKTFQIISLDKLNNKESREAILKPIQSKACPVTFNEHVISEIIKHSRGYPYFIQFYCKESFDSILQQGKLGIKVPNFRIPEIIRKLDSDFYSESWNQITDRQRELLSVIAKLPTANEEFTIKDMILKSAAISRRPFKAAHINNMIIKLMDFGLIFKRRWSKYLFAVPLFADYINRQADETNDIK